MFNFEIIIKSIIFWANSSLVKKILEFSNLKKEHRQFLLLLIKKNWTMAKINISHMKNEIEITMKHFETFSID